MALLFLNLVDSKKDSTIDKLEKRPRPYRLDEINVIIKSGNGSIKFLQQDLRVFQKNATYFMIRRKESLKDKIFLINIYTKTGETSSN